MKTHTELDNVSESKSRNSCTHLTLYCKRDLLAQSTPANCNSARKTCVMAGIEFRDVIVDIKQK